MCNIIYVPEQCESAKDCDCDRDINEMRDEQWTTVEINTDNANFNYEFDGTPKEKMQGTSLLKGKSSKVKKAPMKRMLVVTVWPRVLRRCCL